MEAISYNKMTRESLDEKTLTPNELGKREEIVKSLKKRQSDFVRRYGADRAKSVMYAVATKTAKAVTEETELTEAQLDEMGYGSARSADHEFSRFGTVVPQKKAKFILKHKATGRVLSIHADAPSAVAARNKIGSFTTHAIIKEESADFEKQNSPKTKKQIQREHLEQTGEFLSLDEINLDERIDMPQGHKYSADPITKASDEGKGHKKPQMGTKTNTAAIIAAILNKTKE